MQLNQLERVRSQLAIGSFFGKVGLLNEAQCELEVLVGQNGNSESAEKLLRQIRSW